MTDTTTPSSNSKEQTIEELQARYQSLNTRKIQAEAHLDNARKQLATLKQEAIREYGTDDLTELREKLTTMKAENEQKRKSYQADLDRIESELAEVDERFAATETPPVDK
ncbi:MAG TPA: hypothetical protein VGN12_19995 [Pirellulales bacterium]|jgi:uncharacterized protein involved in exopolysaccharide biosynthesis